MTTPPVRPPSMTFPPLGETLKIPMLRTALLWGIGVGFAAGAHKFRMNGLALTKRSVLHSCDRAVLGFVGGTTVAWFALRREMDAKQDNLTEKLKALQRKSGSDAPTK